MPSESQQPAQRPAAPFSPLDPKLERTLVAAGWRLQDLRSPQRSPLADLAVADLAASLVTPAPDGTWMARGTADPSATQMASDWTWMDALKAMSGADPAQTLITPGRRQAAPASDLERTRIAPWNASDLLPATPTTEDAPTQVQPPAPASLEVPQLPEVPECPELMPGVQLLGTMRDTGFAEQQWLAQRGADFVQLSELLYRVLEQVDGTRTLAQIAARAREVTGRPVSENNVRLLIAARLLPLGLIVPVDGVPAAAPPSATRSPLAITLRLGFVGPNVIEPVARVLQVLYWPPLLIPLALLIAASQAWIFFVHGAAAPFAAVLTHPLLLFAISGVVLLSAVSHEFGHASALRYGGGRARGIGFGVYYIYPAFYTDCTDSYRLSRWGRMRTDLGGVYFDLLLGLALVVAYLLTRQEALLATVILVDLEIGDQFLPTMRFDGYWALADLVGVPDFFALMRPVLRSTLTPLARRLPVAGGANGAGDTASQALGATAPQLKGWVRVVFLAYTAITVPFLLAVFALLLGNAPSIAGFYGDALAGQVTAARLAMLTQPGIAVAVAWGQVVLLLLTAAVMFYGVANLARSLVRAVWSWGSATSRRRILSLLTLAAGTALLALVWRGQLVVLVPHFAHLLGR